MSVMHFVLSVVAAFIVATTAAPAHRFSRVDFEIHLQYKIDKSVQTGDPYYIARPSAFAILVLSLDLRKRPKDHRHKRITSVVLLYRSLQWKL